jgi:hypothetical protein
MPSSLEGIVRNYMAATMMLVHACMHPAHTTCVSNTLGGSLVLSTRRQQGTAGGLCAIHANIARHLCTAETRAMARKNSRSLSKLCQGAHRHLLASNIEAKSEISQRTWSSQSVSTRAGEVTTGSRALVGVSTVLTNEATVELRAPKPIKNCVIFVIPRSNVRESSFF